MYILGIDYGQKNIGIAIADKELGVAMPYKNVKNKDFLSFLKDIIKEMKIGEVIVGLPVGLEGEKTDFTKPAQDFIKKLKKELEIPVFEFDERFTTQMAKKLIGKEPTHKVAAQIILQNYLDKNN